MKIIINHSSMIPIYEQIVEQVKALIRNGKLKENDNNFYEKLSDKTKKIVKVANFFLVHH